MIGDDMSFARDEPGPVCTCKCINAMQIPGAGWRGCKDDVHCGRSNKGCGFRRGDAW
jgi:hypothetical protein